MPTAASLWNVRPVPRVAAPSPAAFRREIVARGEPVVLTGMVGAEARRALAFAALRAHAASEVPVARVRDGRVVIDEERGLVVEPRPLGELLSALESGRLDGYLASPVDRLPPTLARLVPVPDALGAFPWRVTKLWVGGAGTVSALHRDLAHNLHTVLDGCKRFWLASPEDDRCVYPNPLWSSLPNGSRVDPERPDFARFPRLSRVRAWQVDVRAGETLFLPHRWWHHVRTMEPTVAANTFFARGPLALVTATAAAFKSARGLNV